MKLTSKLNIDKQHIHDYGDLWRFIITLNVKKIYGL